MIAAGRVRAAAEAAAVPALEAAAHGDADRARLVGFEAETRAAAAFAVEREMRVFVGGVVDVGDEGPMLGLKARVQIEDSERRELEIEHRRTKSSGAAKGEMGDEHACARL